MQLHCNNKLCEYNDPDKLLTSVGGLDLKDNKGIIYLLSNVYFSFVLIGDDEMNILGNILRKKYKKAYIKAYDKYKNMPEEERKFEYAYLEANLKTIPTFSILSSIIVFMCNMIFPDKPILFVIILCGFLIVTIFSIMNTSYYLDVLREIDKDNKSN